MRLKPLNSHDSFEPIALRNGDRKALFQETAGGIRQAIFSSKARYWTSETSHRLTDDAKNNTPFAVINLVTPMTDATVIFFNVSTARLCKAQILISLIQFVNYAFLQYYRAQINMCTMGRWVEDKVHDALLSEFKPYIKFSLHISDRTL